MTKPDLRSLLVQHVARLEHEAQLSGGVVDTERLADVEKLKRLADLTVVSARPRRYRLELAVVVVVTFAATTWLLFDRIDKAEVTFSAISTILSFKSRQAQQLTNIVPVLGVEVDFYEGYAASGSGRNPLDLRNILFLAEEGTNSLSLSSLTVASGQEVSVKGERDWLTLEFDPALRGVEVTVAGPVQINGSDPSTMDVLYILRTVERLAIRLASLGERESTFGRDLLVSDLGILGRTEEILEESSFRRSVSGLRGGTLTWHSVGEEKLDLAEGSWIEFDGVDGELQRVRILEEGLDFAFRGEASDVRVGSRYRRGTRMPSILAWIHAQWGLKLLWASSLWALGVLLVLLRWWKGGSL